MARRSSTLASSFARAASTLRLVPPKTSISQLASNPAWKMVPAVVARADGEVEVEPVVIVLVPLAAGHRAGTFYRRQERSSGFGDVSTRLNNTRPGLLKVEIGLRRLVDETVEYRITEGLPPGNFFQRQSRPRLLLAFGPLRRGFQGRAPIVRPHRSTTAQEKSEADDP